jgi:WD40 repeat protein
VYSGLDFKERCGGAFGVALSPDRSLIAFGGNGSKLFLVDLKSGKLLWDLGKDGHTNIVNSVYFTPDGKCMVSNGGDGTMRIWDIEKRKSLALFKFRTRFFPLLEGEKSPRVHEMAGDYDYSMRFALSPDGRTVAVGGNTRGEIPFVELDTGKIVKNLKIKQDLAWSVQFTADGKWLIVGGSQHKGIIEIWDIEKDKIVTSFGRHEWGICHLVISPDKKTLVSGGVSDGFRVWDVASGKQKFSYFTKDDPRMPRIKVVREDAKPTISEHTRSAGCAFLPDGKTFLIVPHWTFWNTEIYFHDTATGRPVDYRERVKALPGTKAK